MSEFDFDIDLRDLLQLPKKIEKQVRDSLMSVTDEVQKQTAYKIENDAKQKLHTLRGAYLSAVHVERTSDTAFTFKLDDSVKFIEEGQKAYNMLDVLLKSPKAKMSKDGETYLVVPFKHNTPLTASIKKNTDAKKMYTSLRKQLKNNYGIDLNAIEKTASGNPRRGVLHTFSNQLKSPVSKPTDATDRFHGLQIIQKRNPNAKGGADRSRNDF